MQVRLGSLIAGILVAGIIVACIVPLVGAAERGKPNIIIFYADDLGWGECGCYGCKDIPTPHIDAIAKNGVRFTQGYVAATYCSPSRAGLMTGRYPTRFDLSESNDLATKKPETVRELQKLWDRWNAEQAEPSAPDAPKPKANRKKKQNARRAAATR